MPRHVSDSWQSYLGPGALSSLVLALLTAVLGLGVPVLVCLRRVLREARCARARPADLILVLGRVLDDDRPSPVFAARLAQGASLWRAGVAPRVVVAGGLTGSARRTEAEAGRELLLELGVPGAAILVEDRSRHTLENLFNVRETMRAHGWSALVLVTDPLHLARASALARGLGLDIAPVPATAAAPARGSVGWWSRAIREACLLHWYHVGVLYSRAIRSERLLSRVT